MIVINSGIMIFCIVLIAFVMFNFYKVIHTFDQKRHTYVLHLIETNDIESLKKMGEINMFGQYERWYPNYYSLHKYLKDKSLTDKKTGEYLLVFEQYKSSYLRYIIAIVILFFGFSYGLENISSNNYLKFIITIIVLFTIFGTIGYMFKKSEQSVRS